MQSASVQQMCYRVATRARGQHVITAVYYCLQVVLKLPGETIDCCWTQRVLISQFSTSLVDVNCILIMFVYRLTAFIFPSF